MLKRTVCASLLVLLFAASCVRGKRVIRAAKEAERTGCHIVKLKDDTSHMMFERTLENALDRSEDGKVYARSEGVYKFFTVKLSEEALNEVKEFDSVQYIAEDAMAKVALDPYSWALDRIDQVSPIGDGMYDPGKGRNGEGVDIYILDTGIRYDHSEFGGRALYPGFDPTDDYYNTTYEGEDCYGHGTHVASLAAGNLYGVAKNATVYSVRVLDCDGFGSWSVIISGLDLAVDEVMKRGRPAVISMSLGGYILDAVNDAVQAATDAGVPVVVSAGNDYGDACMKSPASAPTAVTVGGTAEGDKLYYATNAGSCVDIFAPGEHVLGAIHLSQNRSLNASGTSMAAPIVSGVLAIYLQEQPLLSVQELTQLLIDNSIKGAVDFSPLEQYGLAKTTPNRLVQVHIETRSKFQLKFGRVQDCSSWKPKKAKTLEQDLQAFIATNLKEQCNCTFDDDFIRDGSFNCYNSTSEVSYRANIAVHTLTSSPPYLSTVIRNHLQTWAELGNAYFVSELTRMWIDKDCSVAIDLFSDPECESSQVCHHR